MDYKILNPVWANPNKDRIICVYEYVLEDGTIQRKEASVLKEPVTGNTQEWDRIFQEFDEEAITANTENIVTVQKALIEQSKMSSRETKERDASEVLFEAKLALFEIPEIKNSKNRTLKSRIRKATNIYEAQAFTALLLMKETNEE